MAPRGGAPWLPSALLFLQVPGCLSLSGPSRVTGTVGGSLSVQCQYEAEFTEQKKYWCKGRCPTLLKKIVETTKSEREVRRGRVSIRDDPANLTFTVTLENLEKGDEGTYWCGIDRPWREIGWDVTFKVLVSVIPGPTLKVFTSTQSSPSVLPVTTRPNMTRRETPDPSQHPRSLLGSVHFLVLVFLKVPLLLSMLGAVLWVNRPQSSAPQRTRNTCSRR
ncbi:PREDICTED: CMRF35-like molecule 6 [Miniopterus natalensis]|uniref:CMRF35-like molecule 6 n=1 Tax=Miniopterus natalensis TaxID=291302 RepID=UPI0007A6F80F|nr:PREDICTED: CMRF35-like molecule 6 [Miniopterus natalensis]